MHDGLGFLEVGDCERAAKPTDTALLEAALGEAVVDRRPRVRPDGAGLDLAADSAAGVDAAGEDAGREAIVGGVGERDGVGLGVEYFEGRDRAEDLLLDDVGSTCSTCSTPKGASSDARVPPTESARGQT